LSDTLAIVRSLGALLTILGIMAGALWAVRRFNLVLPGSGPAADRRLAVVERLSLDPRRSLALLRRDGVEHLVLLAPEGHLVIESRIEARADTVPVVKPPPRVAAVPGAATALFSRLGHDFGALVERARQPLGDQQAGPKPVVHRSARRTTARATRNRNAQA
jgi:hypothetical protein